MQCCIAFCHTTTQISHNYNYTSLSLASLPSPHPIPPGHHTAPDWVPCAAQQLLTSYPSYTDRLLCVDATFCICPTLGRLIRVDQMGQDVISLVTLVTQNKGEKFRNKSSWNTQWVLRSTSVQKLITNVREDKLKTCVSFKWIKGQEYYWWQSTNKEQFSIRLLVISEPAMICSPSRV